MHGLVGAMPRCTAHLLPIHTVVAGFSGRSLQGGDTIRCHVMPRFPQHPQPPHHDHLPFPSLDPSLPCPSSKSPRHCQLPVASATIGARGSHGINGEAGTYLLPGVTHGALKRDGGEQPGSGGRPRYRTEPRRAGTAPHLRSTLSWTSLHPSAAMETSRSLLPLRSGGERGLSEDVVTRIPSPLGLPSPTPGCPMATHTVSVLALVSSTPRAACHPLGQRDPGSGNRDPPRPDAGPRAGSQHGWAPFPAGGGRA